MKVYIVTQSYDYETTEILGVFKDKMKAKLFMSDNASKMRIESGEESASWTGETKGHKFQTIKIGDCAFVTTEWGAVE